MAVRMTRPLVPCWMTEPVVRIWNISVRRYTPKNIRSSVRPVKASHVSCGERRQLETNTPRGYTGVFFLRNDSSIENVPTAAFLRLEKTMRATTTMTLKPQAIMLATLPSEPSVCTNGIPHSGFTPTGAVAGLADKPVRRAASLWST
jgi:hypothetical protein